MNEGGLGRIDALTQPWSNFRRLTFAPLLPIRSLRREWNWREGAFPFKQPLKEWQPSVQFSSVQPLSRVRLFATPWITARQTSLSITNSRSLLKLMCIELVMPSSHLILCCPLLLPPIPPSIRVFSNESALHMRWPKYWNFSFSISPFSEHPGLIGCDKNWLEPTTN